MKIFGIHIYTLSRGLGVILIKWYSFRLLRRICGRFRRRRRGFLSIILDHHHPPLRRLTGRVEPMAHSNSGFSEASDLLAAALEQMDGILASNYQVDNGPT